MEIFLVIYIWSEFAIWIKVEKSEVRNVKYSLHEVYEVFFRSIVRFSFMFFKVWHFFKYKCMNIYFHFIGYSVIHNGTQWQVIYSLTWRSLHRLLSYFLFLFSFQNTIESHPLLVNRLSEPPQWNSILPTTYPCLLQLLIVNFFWSPLQLQTFLICMSWSMFYKIIFIFKMIIYYPKTPCITRPSV